MKYRNLLLLPLLFAACSTLSAQQEPYYTHFAFNKLLYNPAYAGSSGGFCLSMINHKQWMQLPDQTGLFKTESGLLPIQTIPNAIGPLTNGFSFSAPFSLNPDKDYGGVYVANISDVVAYENNTYYKIGLAGAIPLGNDAYLRAGVDATSLTKRLNTSALRPQMQNDPRIPVGGNPADTRWLLGGGLFAKLPHWHNLQVGASLSSINRRSFEYLNSLGGKVLVETAKHLYITGSWTVDNAFHNANLRLDPNLMIRTVNNGNGWVKPQLDAQALLTYAEKFSIGTGIRGHITGTDAAYLLLGIYPIEALHLQNPGNHTLRIGFAYDFTLQSLKLSSRNTREIQVNYCFHLQRIKHPTQDSRDIIGHPDNE